MIFRIPGGICDRSSWGVKHTKNTRAWSKGSSMETKGYLAIQSWISEIKFMASPWIPEKKNTCQRDHPAWVSPLKILKIDTLQNAFLFVKNHHANQAASWFRNPFSVFSIETHQMFKRVFKLKHFAPWKIRDLLVRRLKSPFWKCLHSFFSCDSIRDQSLSPTRWAQKPVRSYKCYNSTYRGYFHPSYLFI